MYTWRRNESKSRLDRGLYCHTWLRCFPNQILMGLNRSFSDHNPLLLKMEAYSNWGPKPFRCYDAWFLNPQLKRFLVNEWRNIPNVALHTKLKILKAPMKNWRKKPLITWIIKSPNLKRLYMISKEKVITECLIIWKWPD